MINDENSSDLLASPLSSQDREASSDRSQVYHSERENFVPDSCRLETSTERPVALMHSESERNFRSILEEQRQQLLSESPSEISKQERRAEKAETDMRELQRQVQSTRMEFGHNCEKSRRERAQLYEALSVQERALLENRIRGIQEVEELRRNQERQIDQLSRQKLRESQPTIDEFHCSNQ